MDSSTSTRMTRKELFLSTSKMISDDKYTLRINFD